MPTTMRFRRDGVALHIHPVAGSAHPEGRWHGPWERHPSDPQAHSREDAEHPFIHGRYPISWERREFNLRPGQEETYLRSLRGERLVDYIRPRERVQRFGAEVQVDAETVVSIPSQAIAFERRFGVEIECIMDIAAFIAACARKGVRVMQRGYTHITPTPTTWMLTPDGSLMYSGGRPGFRTIECVSPILQGAAGMQALKSVCEALAETNAMVNKTCGLHVHHDAVMFTANQAKDLAWTYVRATPIIDKLVAPSRRAAVNPTFCRPLTASDVTHYFEPATSVGGMVGINRYKTLNFAAYARHKTVEFRQHQGSVDFNKIAAWVKFGHLMMHAAASGARIEPNPTAERFYEFLGMSEDLKSFFNQRASVLANGGS